MCARASATVPMETAAAAVAPSTGLPSILSAGTTFVRHFFFRPNHPSIEFRVAVDTCLPLNRPTAISNNDTAERGSPSVPCRGSSFHTAVEAVGNKKARVCRSGRSLRGLGSSGHDDSARGQRNWRETPGLEIDPRQTHARTQHLLRSSSSVRLALFEASECFTLKTVAVSLPPSTRGCARRCECEVTGVPRRIQRLTHRHRPRLRDCRSVAPVPSLPFHSPSLSVLYLKLRMIVAARSASGIKVVTKIFAKFFAPRSSTYNAMKERALRSVVHVAGPSTGRNLCVCGRTNCRKARASG